MAQTRSAALTPACPTGKSVGATGQSPVPTPQSPRPKKKLAARPPRGGVTIHGQEREAGPPLAPVRCRHPTTCPERRPPRLARSAPSRGPARQAPEPRGYPPLHRRGELGAFSSGSGPPCVSLRPRQHCAGRWRPSKMPVLVATLHRRQRPGPPRGRPSPPARTGSGTRWNGSSPKILTGSDFQRAQAESRAARAGPR